MVFKKHNWIKYGRRGRTAKLEIYNEDGKLLDKAEWLIYDKESERKIFTIFKNTWGVFKVPTIPNDFHIKDIKKELENKI